MSLIHKDNSFMVGAIAFIIIIILLSAVYFAYGNSGRVDSIHEQSDDIPIIDDQISPLTNQGLVLEVLRIRHRGLLDEIVKMGTSWKDDPMYYFVSNIDGQEYVSKDIEGAGGVTTEDPFVGWDSIFQEHKIMRDAEEEQLTSTISLTIMEMKKSGLFGRRVEYTEGDKIEITYDYKTGHWTGNDYLGDNDGYGHYLGDKFEIWFNVYQTDFDQDRIPYWTEVNLYGTNPQVDDRYLDQDNDGIPTSWEWKYGYDPLTWDDHNYLDPDVDGIENIEEYKISKWFSDPFSPDIYIEVDGMESGGLLDPAHYMYKESQQIIIERFAQHGFNVYFDDGWPGGPVNGGGELVRHVETLSQDAGQMLQYYRNNFADERKGTFRYLLIGHNTGFAHPSESNKVDCFTADTSLLKLIKRAAFTPRTQRIVLASATLHELGHSLGLHSWTFPGVDNKMFMQGEEEEFEKTYINYESIMNYYYIFSRDYLLDYSDGSNGQYDQDDWGLFFLPHFQDVDVTIEEPYFYNKEDAEDFIINKNPEPLLESWEYNMGLTENISIPSDIVKHLYFDDYLWRLYEKTDEDEESSNRIIRLYVHPNIDPTYRTWTLIAEGLLNEDNELEFYSYQNEIERIVDE